MKIKGGGCVGLCQGFNPNESQCQCYGCQKPCGGGRRACGRRELYGGCCGCDEPPPQPHEECKTCAEGDYIFTRYKNEIWLYTITKNKNGIISAQPGDADIPTIKIDVIKQKIYYEKNGATTGHLDVNFEGLITNQNGRSCFIKATSIPPGIVGYKQTMTCVKSSCVRNPVVSVNPVVDPVVEKIATISKQNESSKASENIIETNIKIKETRDKGLRAC